MTFQFKEKYGNYIGGEFIDPVDGKYFDNHANITDVPTATLLGAINHSAGFEAMPKSQAKLSQGKIDTITTWINEGSLDN